MRGKTTRRLLKMAGFPSLFCCLALAQQAAKPDLSTIIQGMENLQTQTQTQTHTSYQIIREYRLSGSRNSSVDADVVAQMDFKSPASRDYSIQKWSGSARGKQIVQRVLDHEVAPSGDSQARALTRDNYYFSLIGETLYEGRSCYVLGLKPKRKEKDLLSGTAWVEKTSFLLVHIEGEPAKTPSWWFTSVRVKVSFDDVFGAWLQTSMEVVADIRLFGSHTLTSRILDYRSAGISASTKLAPLVQLPFQNPAH
jgi:hypothetical protein